MNKVIENNKLIAEFMTKEPEVLKRDLNKAGTLESMQYHSSWDWLMPVVDKIEDFLEEHSMALFNVQIEQCWCEILDNKTSDTIAQGEGNNKLDATYDAVVQFIKWYNKQNK